MWSGYLGASICSTGFAACLLELIWLNCLDIAGSWNLGFAWVVSAANAIPAMARIRKDVLILFIVILCRSLEALFSCKLLIRATYRRVKRSQAFSHPPKCNCLIRVQVRKGVSLCRLSPPITSLNERCSPYVEGFLVLVESRWRKWPLTKVKILIIDSPPDLDHSH